MGFHWTEGKVNTSYSHKPQFASVTGQLYVWAALTRGHYGTLGATFVSMDGIYRSLEPQYVREFSVSD